MLHRNVIKHDRLDITNNRMDLDSDGWGLAYGIAIPNILSRALCHYREQAGKAGALFGLTYYLLLGCMLGLAGLVQKLGLVLTVCALMTLILQPKPEPPVNGN